MKDRIKIWVYAHWENFAEPKLMGFLYAIPVKGKETFSFEYSKEWLQSGFSQILDPDLQLYPGAYYPRNDKPNFGIFLDSCPDRWGRILMQRREEVIAKNEKRNPRKLLDSDFLLGLFDGNRMGALRFKLEENENFLNDNIEMATPPWTSLKLLEEASMKFELQNKNNSEILKWINLLIAPGSSLGGARPKSSVVDPKNHLWIAKFPSKYDEKDIAAWEMVAHELGEAAGLKMAIAKIQKFQNKHHTFLTKRFDRTANGSRIHFASAMTLLGYKDGENSLGASYLEIVEFIIRNGANVAKDLEELWRRIVFSILIKNTDDHLRNHGFLLTHKGWILSPAYDINPNEFGEGLSLNISEASNALDIDLALALARYFRLDSKRSNKILKQVQTSVRKWSDVAGKYKISKREQERMKTAFQSI
jgi:serine/threonine-protein kinase HipA